MYHLFPRELTISTSGGVPRLRLSPVPEVALHLRQKQITHNHTVSYDGSDTPETAEDQAETVLAKGSSLDVVMHCTLTAAAAPTSGQITVEVLADPSPGTSALVVGYDFATELSFVDHARMGNATIVQTAPLPRAHALAGPESAPLLRVLLDGAMIESFGGGTVAITAFVTPTGTASPADRVVRLGTPKEKPVGVVCNVSTYALSLSPAAV